MGCWAIGQRLIGTHCSFTEGGYEDTERTCCEVEEYLFAAKRNRLSAGLACSGTYLGLNDDVLQIRCHALRQTVPPASTFCNGQMKGTLSLSLVPRDME